MNASIVYLKDKDGTGSMHVCAKGDKGAVAYVREHEKIWHEGGSVGRAKILKDRRSPCPDKLANRADSTQEMIAEIECLRARCAQLEKALEPFASRATDFRFTPAATGLV